MAIISKKLLVSRRGIVYLTGRGIAVVRGFLLSLFLRHVLGAKVGKGLLCYGWPRYLSSWGSLTMGTNVSLGRCALIQIGLDAELTIADEVSMGDYITLTAEKAISIGKQSMCAEFISIRDFDHRFLDPNIPCCEQGLESSAIIIGSDVWLGRGVAVLKGVEIGNGVVVGANSVVSRSLDPYVVAVGAPARPRKLRGSSTST